ncbi:hypothetical protein BJ912DRAFT_1064055 [Pholiota molesta]|nr:hypothetical protein BJ912DRAFT_1064055 [Pholiota molesta]
MAQAASATIAGIPWELRIPIARTIDLVSAAFSFLKLTFSFFTGFFTPFLRLSPLPVLGYVCAARAAVRLSGHHHHAFSSVRLHAVSDSDLFPGSRLPASRLKTEPDLGKTADDSIAHNVDGIYYIINP